MQKNKKILLTGSSGFVGSYFINKYKDKYNVDCSDICEENII